MGVRSCDGIGRREGLKIPCPYGRMGSNPIETTMKYTIDDAKSHVKQYAKEMRALIKLICRQ